MRRFVIFFLLLFITIPAFSKNVKFKNSIFSVGMEKEINFISSIFLSPKGYIVITDSKNNRIYWLNEKGRIVRKLGNPGNDPGEFNNPQDLSIDKDGNIYVADTGNNRIQVFNKKGSFLYEFGESGDENKEFASPSGIFVSDKGYIYVADTGNNRIQVFKRNGSFISKFGFEGEEEGEFDSPVSVTVDEEGKIYVTDQGNVRIQVFDKDGIFIKSFGKEGEKPGEFDEIKDIFYDKNNAMLFITDSGNHVIHIFDKNGSFFSTFGLRGEEQGMFEEPQGIMVSEEGDIYIADAGNSRVQLFRIKGMKKKEEKKTDKPKQDEKITAPEKKQLIGVFKLENIGKEAAESDYGEVFAYNLHAEFSKNDYFKVAEKAEIEKSLKKNKLDKKSIDREKALIVGNDIYLGAVVIGSVTKLKNAITIDVKVINTLNDNKICSFDEKLSEETQIRDTCKKIIKKIIQFYHDNNKKELKIPTNLKTKANASTIEIKWTKGEEKDLAGYYIYRSEKEDGDYRFIGWSSGSSFKDKTCEPGNQYFYKVTSVNLYGAESDFSIFKSDKLSVQYLELVKDENIREKSTSKSKKLLRVKKKTKLIYLDKEIKGYLKIRLEDGRTGWIWKKSAMILE